MDWTGTAMNITITGATGFLGRPLVARLAAAGHQLHVLGRRRSESLPLSAQFSAWDATNEPPHASLESAEAIIHLAGEPVAQRWTADVKQRIYDSRVKGTANLVAAIAGLSRRPRVLISGSAIGIYGSRGDEPLVESSAPGTDFLARLGLAWEAEAVRAETLGLRVVTLRTGLVLGRGGALAKMLPPFRLGVGGKIGSGHQWMSWIHIRDWANLVSFALENPGLRGPVNATAPGPVTNEAFTRALAAVLHRPAILPVPEFALKLMFGEMGDVILASQRVLPKAARAAGFQFEFPELQPALLEILHRG